MDTMKLLAFGLIVLGLLGASSMASAISITDGNDNVYFAGETITMTNWDNCTQRYTYMWIVNASNRSQAYIGSAQGTGAVANLTSGAEISGNVSSSCTFVINTTVLMVNTARSAQTYYIYLRSTYDATSPNITFVDAVNPDTYVDLNNFTVSIAPDRSAGYGVLPGDNATITITTSGPSSAATREAAEFTVATTESGVTPVETSTTSDGVIVFAATAGTAAVDRANVTISNGVAVQTGTYAVRQFSVQAYDRTVNTALGSNVLLETLNESGGRANWQTSLNQNLTFTLTISGLADNVWGGVASNYSINWTFTNQTNLSTVTTALNTNVTTGTGTITATCHNFTLTDSDTYIVRAATENLTLTGTTLNGTDVDDTFYIGQNVSFTGWISNTSVNVSFNVSLVNGSALSLIWSGNETNISFSSDGTFTMNWSTNDNWVYTSFSNPVYALPAGTYRVYMWKTQSVGENTTADVAITNALSITATNSTYNGTALTNEVYVDNNLTIAGLSSRTNGKMVLLNITGTSYSKLENLTLVTGAGPTLTNGTYTMTWNTSNVNATGTYTIYVTDRVTTASTTVTVRNNLSIDNLPETGPTGNVVIFNGTTTRANGTMINVTIRSAILSQVVCTAVTPASGGRWGLTWNTTNDCSDSGTPLTNGATYIVNVTDNVSSVTDSITLGTGSITELSLSESSVFVDKLVNITGATNYGPGTTVHINVTNCTNSTSVIYNTTVVVNSTFQFSASFTPADNATQLLQYVKTLAAGVPADICVVANISNVTKNATLEIKDNLALTTASSVLMGDNLLLTGTSSRANFTTITIYVTRSGTDYNISRLANVTSQGPAYTTGAFINNTYNATIDGAAGDNLTTGTYTITATDGLVTTTASFTVTDTETLAITSPTDYQEISLGDLFPVIGTSNKANGTAVSITVIGITTGANTSQTLSATVNTSGLFEVNWPTINYTVGDYILSASTGTASSEVIHATLTAASTTTTTTTSGSTTTTTLAGTGEGDIDGSGVVDVEDLEVMAEVYGLTEEDAGWDASANLDDEHLQSGTNLQIIDLWDLMILADTFGNDYTE